MAARGIGQAGHGRLEQRRAIFGGEVGGEGRVDARDPLFEGELLGGRDRDGVLAREVVLERHGSGRRVAGGLRAHRALQVEGPRRDDVARRQLADARVERLLGEDVRSQDRREGEDEDPGRDEQARDVAPGELGGLDGTLGQHRWVIG